jgi:hypothetical protein
MIKTFMISSFFGLFNSLSLRKGVADRADAFFAF